MTTDVTPSNLSKCLNCGFDAPAGGAEWDNVESPPLGRMTRCPECGSTDVLSGR